MCPVLYLEYWGGEGGCLSTLLSIEVSCVKHFCTLLFLVHLCFVPSHALCFQYCLEECFQPE